MRRDSPVERIRAVVLAALLVVSVLAMTVTVTGPAAAAANSASFDVTEDATQSDNNITVTGDTGTDGANVTFLIQDPVDDDVATVIRDTDSTNTSFEVDVNLSTVSFGGGDGSLDEGTATILVDEGDSFEGSEANDTFVVDDTKPTGSIAKPSYGAEENSQPVIEGNASDDTEVASVDLVIQNGSGDYYNGSAFISNETTVSANGTENWTYNTSDEGISSDGEYDVKIEVTDTAGNVKDVLVPYPGGETTETSYTVDSTQPTLSSLSVTDDGDGNITDGDTVDVSVDVTDATSGVDTVTVDASELGGGANEELTVDSGDTYTTSFDVSDPTAGDGDINLTVTATDNFGNSNQSTAVDALTLKTSVAGVEDLTIDHEFVGIVKDDSELVVNATGITDPQGNTISGPTTVDISITGTSTTYSATVTNGTLNTTIDTTAIANTAGTGDETVEIAQANAGADTAGVELVHEALDLDEGYQAVGTPMAAENLVFEEVNDVISYDPTAKDSENEWESTDGEQAGEGYYIEGDSDDARVGYLFDSNPNEGPDARTLHEGWNLVGTAVDLSETDSHNATVDLGGAVTVDGNDNVEVWTRDEDHSLNQSDGSTGYVEGGASTTVNSFEGYFVYIENTEETRNVDVLGYDAGDRN